MRREKKAAAAPPIKPMMKLKNIARYAMTPPLI